MTVAELLARASSRELSEWMAYYAVEPWGAERDNLHAGIVASATVNLWRDSEDEPVKSTDFLLQFGEPDEVQPAKTKDLFDMVKTWAILSGVSRGNDAEDAGS